MFRHANLSNCITNLVLQGGGGESVTNTAGIQSNSHNALRPADVGAANQSGVLQHDDERDLLPEPDVRHILVEDYSYFSKSMIFKP